MCGHFHRDDQIHGGARYIDPKFRAICTLTTFFTVSSHWQPERITGREYSICADVWSMGLSILELVQNRFPFPSDLAPVDLIMHITTGEVRPFVHLSDLIYTLMSR